ncbi:hypothetical protein G647_01356 [Cladophialophora carrionii CBS 160.54]|uniref:Uncharacterized protein n=1 Tax=Cladophialophora carrionii CBS 160.54 TaxID=1279043 RepID=V9DPS4_9EURO|nr:uncharacterized protein G647_01356 [Cladophialophora carrionii CBS 160.54]ETI28904.1 hypothetical protein G647_01356 [Cladophialophora carrionii CBS 160.54]
MKSVASVASSSTALVLHANFQAMTVPCSWESVVIRFICIVF